MHMRRVTLLLSLSLLLLGAGCQTQEEYRSAYNVGYDIGYNQGKEDSSEEWSPALEECNDQIRNASDYCDESYVDINDTVCSLSEVSEP